MKVVSSKSSKIGPKLLLLSLSSKSLLVIIRDNGVGLRVRKGLSIAKGRDAGPRVGRLGNERIRIDTFKVLLRERIEKLDLVKGNLILISV